MLQRPISLRVDTDSPAGNTWQGSLRTPGGTRVSGTTQSRLGTPDLDLSRQQGSSGSGSSHRASSSKGPGLGLSALASPREFHNDGSGSPHSSMSSESPRTPGCIGGLESPDAGSDGSRAGLKSAGRKDGGVRVGKRMSVVLAQADNAGELSVLVT